MTTEVLSTDDLLSCFETAVPPERDIFRDELRRRLNPERTVWVVVDRKNVPKRAQTFQPTRRGMLDDETAVLYGPVCPTISTE
jgi:hypothetical protein